MRSVAHSASCGSTAGSTKGSMSSDKRSSKLQPLDAEQGTDPRRFGQRGFGHRRKSAGSRRWVWGTSGVDCRVAQRPRSGRRGRRVLLASTLLRREAEHVRCRQPGRVERLTSTAFAAAHPSPARLRPSAAGRRGGAPTHSARAERRPLRAAGTPGPERPRAARRQRRRPAVRAGAGAHRARRWPAG